MLLVTQQEIELCADVGGIAWENRYSYCIPGNEPMEQDQNQHSSSSATLQGDVAIPYSRQQVLDSTNDGYQSYNCVMSIGEAIEVRRLIELASEIMHNIFMTLCCKFVLN